MFETKNCAESSLGVCKKCVNRYYLDKRNDTCLKQENNLLYCKITIDGNYCEECDDNYFFSKDEKCVETNFCLNSENNICKQCIYNYYLSDNNKVCTNEENCKIGDGKNGVCLSCLDGFYYNKINGKCFSNQENNKFKNCLISDNEYCLKCNYSFYLGEDKKCSNTQYCVESENSICQKCDSNHHLDLENYCSSIEHCIHSGGFISICYECEEGFYFSRSSFKCLDDSDENVKNCKYSDYYSETCVECRDNFYLNTTDNKCYSNTEQNNFYKCKKSDSIYENCLECNQKYYLEIEDLKCSKIENCAISENENICKNCSDFYCLDMKTGKCEINNEEPEEESKKIYFNCIKTNKNGTGCEICIDDFEPINGICINKNRCEKEINGVCIKCNELSEHGRNLCLNPVFGCVETSTKNCAKCDDEYKFYSCSECNEGYILNEYNECVEELA